MSLDLYGENILEHFKNPVNRGILENADATAFEVNPLCGDELGVRIKVNNGYIVDARFFGTGCAISQAAVDILLEQIKSRSVQDAAVLDKDKFLKTLGIELSALRLRCALLGFKALKIAALKILSQR